jgi:NTP pyrophosphatase (non-canonical NTP hydrolase)
MTFDDYQELTATTAVYPGAGTWVGLVYVGLGLGEAGELQGKVKKLMRDDDFILTDERRSAMVGELGDVLWYAAQMATELGYSLSQIAAMNIGKLQDRMERGVIAGSGDER